MRVIPVLALLLAGGCKKSLEDAKGDADAPEPEPVHLEMSEPAPAAWLAPGAVEASGEAHGLSNIDVNGKPAELSGDTWSTIVTLEPGITTFDVGGDDANGSRHYIRQSVIAGDFTDSGGPVRDAMALRVNQGALNFAGDAVADLVTPAQLTSLVGGTAPIFSDSGGIIGIDLYSVDVFVSSVEFQPLQVSLTPRSGVLELNVVLPELYVVVPVEGEAIGIDINTTAELGASAAELNANLLLGVDADGQLDVQLVQPGIDIRGFYFDTTLIPTDIVADLLADTVQGFIVDLLDEQIQALLPALLASQLSALDLNMDLELLGSQVSLGTAFNTATIDTDGILLAADLDIEVTGEGSSKVSAGVFEVGYEPPQPGTGADVSMAVSDNMLNRLLHEFWQAGMLDMSLSSADGSLDPIMLTSLGGAGSGTIDTVAQLPPVAIEKNGTFFLQIGEMEVAIRTPGGSHGEELDVSLAAEIPLDVEVEGGALVASLGEPVVSIMVRDNDWGGSNKTITNLIEQEVPIDSLLTLFGNIEIELPAIGGFVLPDASVERDGSGLYTAVEMNL